MRLTLPKKDLSVIHVIRVPSVLPKYNQLVIDRLKKSKLIKIKIDNTLPMFGDHIHRRFRRNFNVCQLDDIFFGIDTWDGPTPTIFGHECFYNLSCIFKTTYHTPYINEFREVERKYNLSIYNYPIFHYEKLLEYEFDKTMYWKNNNKFNNFFFSGALRRGGRNRWIEYLKNKKSFFPVCSGWESLFIERSRNCKWGLVLEGKTFCKNRRTVIYASWGYPLILNYIPCYPINLIPNVDYVYAPYPTYLDSIDQIDPKPFSKRSKYFYEKILSPDANARYLLSCLQKVKVEK